jgi:hypothetical protein
VTTPASIEQIADLTRRGQEAATAAGQAVAKAFQGYAAAVTPQGARPVDPQVAAAAAFDLADHLVAAQRAYVTTAIALLTEVGEAATAHASAAGETLKSRTEEATERVIDFAAETTRRAASAARNGVSV